MFSFLYMTSARVHNFINTIYPSDLKLKMANERNLAILLSTHLQIIRHTSSLHDTAADELVAPRVASAQ
jgi:hypothetical protein